MKKIIAIAAVVVFTACNSNSSAPVEEVAGDSAVVKTDTTISPIDTTVVADSIHE